MEVNRRALLRCDDVGVQQHVLALRNIVLCCRFWIGEHLVRKVADLLEVCPA